MFTDGIAQAIKIIDECVVFYQSNNFRSSIPTTILCLAPLTNIQKILELRPDLAKKIIIYAMSGSVNLCYGGKVGPCPEYNVYNDTAAAQVTYLRKCNSRWCTTPRSMRL